MIERPPSAKQIKAARALLDWSQQNLANATQLSIATIRKLESGATSPRQATMIVVRNALEEGGIEFLDADGVRCREEEITVYRGISGRKNFFDDLYEISKRAGSDIALIDTVDGALTVCNDALALFRTIEKDTASFIKCLQTSPITPVFESPQVEWRLISCNYIDPMPIGVCGDVFAMISGTREADIKIVMMRSFSIAQASRRQFLSIWDKATQLQIAKRPKQSLRCITT